jgi:SAM-dependent methyltransferase
MTHHEAWDRNAPFRHEQLISKKDTTFWELLVPHLLELLSAVSGGEKPSLLDVGCGTGVFTKILSERFANVVGVDPSGESIKIAREYNDNDNTSFYCGAIEDYNQKSPGLFDIVLAHMTLHAVEDLHAALDAIYEQLKAEGTFVFSLPHPCFYPIIKEKYFNDYHYMVSSFDQIPFKINKNDPLPSYTPYYHRSLSDYTSMLERSNFVIKKMTEPFPGEELMSKYMRSWFSPGFLVFVCEKNG